MNQTPNNSSYPIIKKGQVVPITGGIVEYKDGNGKTRQLLVQVIPKKQTVDIAK